MANVGHFYMAIDSMISASAMRSVSFMPFLPLLIAHSVIPPPQNE